jgi:glutathione S-transferase
MVTSMRRSYRICISHFSNLLHLFSLVKPLHAYSMNSHSTPMVLTSHSLCPILHAWTMTLTLAGKVAGHDFSVQRLAYSDLPSWSKVIPTGASLPFLIHQNDTLWGSLPVLQWIEETVPGSRLLPMDPVQRVRTRQRALVAIELLDAMKTVFVSKSKEQERQSLAAMFTLLERCEILPWGGLPSLDGVLLAAAATLLTCHDRLLQDARWSQTPNLKATILRLRAHDVVLATKAPEYDTAFGAFFVAFGSSFPNQD